MYAFKVMYVYLYACMYACIYVRIYVRMNYNHNNEGSVSFAKFCTLVNNLTMDFTQKISSNPLIPKTLVSMHTLLLSTFQLLNTQVEIVSLYSLLSTYWYEWK